MKKMNLCLIILMLVTLPLVAYGSSTRALTGDTLSNNTGGSALTVPATGSNVISDSASQTLTNKTISGASNTISGLTVSQMAIGPQAISGTSIDWSTGYIFTKTLSGNTTFTFTGLPSSGTIVVRLTNTVSNFTVTWPAVKWIAGVAPTMSAGAVSDIYTFVYDGANTYGTYTQNLQ